MLELVGYKIITANNGKEGIKKAFEQLPDIILCDIMMPELNGYEVIKQLKSDPATSNIPFIYVTASAEKSEVKKALEMGADGYVRKPFDVSELKTAMENVLMH